MEEYLFFYMDPIPNTKSLTQVCVKRLNLDYTITNNSVSALNLYDTFYEIEYYPVKSRPIFSASPPPSVTTEENDQSP